jgi:hypothetical protein
MRWTRRRVQTITTWAVVVGWAVFYAVALAHADPLPTPDTAVMWLVVPPLLCVVAVRLVLRNWWSETGPPMSAMDLPGRLLAAAVAALPERRREWGRAMTAELAEVQGRSARWRFALSSARAALRLPPAGGWPVLALMIAVVAVATAGPAVGAAVPGLKVFAVSFTGHLGAMVVLAAARPRTPFGYPRRCVVTRSTASCCSTTRWSPPSARTWLMPWPSASASFPCSASPSG